MKLSHKAAKYISKCTFVLFAFIDNSLVCFSLYSNRILWIITEYYIKICKICFVTSQESKYVAMSEVISTGQLNFCFLWRSFSSFRHCSTYREQDALSCVQQPALCHVYSSLCLMIIHTHLQQRSVVIHTIAWDDQLVVNSLTFPRSKTNPGLQQKFVFNRLLLQTLPQMPTKIPLVAS